MKTVSVRECLNIAHQSAVLAAVTRYGSNFRTGGGFRVRLETILNKFNKHKKHIERDDVIAALETLTEKKIIKCYVVAGHLVIEHLENPERKNIFFLDEEMEVVAHA